MIREIKFRVWDGVNMIFNVSISSEGRHWYKEVNGNHGEFYLAEDYPLMQFTGLHDKNGKEIYEGDLLETIVESKTGDRKNVFEVVWNEEYAEFQPRASNGWAPVLKYILEGDAEIIGNIYENSDLLK